MNECTVAVAAAAATRVGAEVEKEIYQFSRSISGIVILVQGLPTGGRRFRELSNCEFFKIIVGSVESESARLSQGLALYVITLIQNSVFRRP